MHSPVDPPAITRTVGKQEMVAHGKALYADHCKIEIEHIESARRVGRLLLDIKKNCEHGEFGTLLKEMEIPSQRASECMVIAKSPAAGVLNAKSVREALDCIKKSGHSPYPREKRCKNCRLKNLDKPHCKACRDRNTPEEPLEDEITEDPLWNDKQFIRSLNTLRQLIDKLVVKAGFIDIRTEQPKPPPQIQGLKRLLDQFEGDSTKVVRECRKQQQQDLFAEKNRRDG